MVKTAVTAPRGAMDSLILQEAAGSPRIDVTGCVGAPGPCKRQRTPGTLPGVLTFPTVQYRICELSAVEMRKRT